MLTFALASYLAAANRQRLAAYRGTASGLVVFVVAELVIGPPIIAQVVMVLAWTLVVLCAGELTQYHRAYRAESRRRPAEAELMREEELRRRSKARPLCMVLPDDRVPTLGRSSTPHEAGINDSRRLIRVLLDAAAGRVTVGALVAAQPLIDDWRRFSRTSAPHASTKRRPDRRTSGSRLRERSQP
jgi:hypothetical protein